MVYPITPWSAQEKFVTRVPTFVWIKMTGLNSWIIRSMFSPVTDWPEINIGGWTKTGFSSFLFIFERVILANNRYTLLYIWYERARFKWNHIKCFKSLQQIFLPTHGEIFSNLMYFHTTCDYINRPDYIKQLHIIDLWSQLQQSVLHAFAVNSLDLDFQLHYFYFDCNVLYLR